MIYSVTLMSHTTPKRTLLNIYQPNQIRLNTLQFPIGTTLTRWINEAITEKLDKLSPETAGASPMVVPPVSAPASFDPMAERRRLLRLQQGPDFVGPYILKYKDTTPYFQAEHEHEQKGSGSPGIEAILEDMHIREGLEMSTEEKGAVLAAHAKAERELAERTEKERQRQEQELAELKALRDAPQVNPHIALRAKVEAVQKAKHEKWLAEKAQAMEETPLVNVASPAMEDAADFWGDEDEAAYHRIRAKACKA